MRCPECGSKNYEQDIDNSSSQEDAYECMDCGEQFWETEGDDADARAED